MKHRVVGFLNEYNVLELEKYLTLKEKQEIMHKLEERIECRLKALSYSFGYMRRCENVSDIVTCTGEIFDGIYYKYKGVQFKILITEYFGGEVGLYCGDNLIERHISLYGLIEKIGKIHESLDEDIDMGFIK